MRIDFNSEEFKKTPAYSTFINDNTSAGGLKVQVFIANQSIPIIGAKVVISKKINGDEVVFFENVTNIDGIVSDIVLPAPNNKNISDLDIPKYESYDINVTNNGYEDINEKVQIYSDIKMIKTIQMSKVIN